MTDAQAVLELYRLSLYQHLTMNSMDAEEANNYLLGVDKIFRTHYDTVMSQHPFNIPAEEFFNVGDLSLNTGNVGRAQKRTERG